MFDKIKERKVLINGSSSGIGFALAEKVASYGGSLVMHGLTEVPETTQKIAEWEKQYGAKIKFIAADLTKEDTHTDDLNSV